jgi:hypothetical protein
VLKARPRQFQHAELAQVRGYAYKWLLMQRGQQHAQPPDEHVCARLIAAAGGAGAACDWIRDHLQDHQSETCEYLVVSMLQKIHGIAPPTVARRRFGPNFGHGPAGHRLARRQRLICRVDHLKAEIVAAQEGMRRRASSSCAISDRANSAAAATVWACCNRPNSALATIPDNASAPSPSQSCGSRTRRLPTGSVAK